MANLAQSVERKAFSVAIDAALKHLNKDREKACFRLLILQKSSWAITSVRKRMTEPER